MNGRHERNNRSERERNNTTRRWIIWLVSGVWAANIGAGMIPALHYEPKESINGIFMAIVGTIFIAGSRTSNDKKDDDKDGHH